MVTEIFVAISLVCPKGSQFDEIIKLSQWNPPVQSNAICLPAFPHLPSWLGTCFEDPGCVFKLNQNASNPESSTWKSDSICAKASRSLPRASVKRLLSFRSDFNVVSSWDIWTFSAFSVALRENNLLMFFCCYTMIVLDWIPYYHVFPFSLHVKGRVQEFLVALSSCREDYNLRWTCWKNNENAPQDDIVLLQIPDLFFGLMQGLPERRWPTDTRKPTLKNWTCSSLEWDLSFSSALLAVAGAGRLPPCTRRSSHFFSNMDWTTVFNEQIFSNNENLLLVSSWTFNRWTFSSIPVTCVEYFNIRR